MHISNRIRLALVLSVIVASVSACSKSAQYYMDRGDALLKQGKIDAAVLEFRNAVQKDQMSGPRA